MIVTHGARVLGAIKTRLATLARRAMPATVIVALSALSLGAYAGHAARRAAVRDASSFSVKATPAHDTIAAGSTAGYSLRIHRRHFRGPVGFKLVRPLPPGLHPQFVPRRTLRSRATLTLRSANSMSEGTYRLVLHATSGKLTKDLTLMLTVAGPASGGGSGNVALPAFTLAGNAEQPLEPGVPQAIDVRITNPNTVPLSVSAIGARVQAISAPHATPSLPCTLGDFSVEQYSGPLPVAVPAHSTRSLSQLAVSAAQWPQVSIIDLPSNQDGCQGATLTLAYSGTARLG